MCEASIPFKSDKRELFGICPICRFRLIAKAGNWEHLINNLPDLKTRDDIINEIKRLIKINNKYDYTDDERWFILRMDMINQPTMTHPVDKKEVDI
jgi:hypothetical protein